MYGEQQTTLFKHLSIEGILKCIVHVIRKTKFHVEFTYIIAEFDIFRTSVYFLRSIMLNLPT